MFPQSGGTNRDARGDVAQLRHVPLPRAAPPHPLLTDVDVTLGTIRIIFISKGLKYFAPLISFFEIMIWLLALTQIMRQLTNFTN